VRKPGFSPELLLHVNYINHLLAVRRSCLERCADPFTDEVSGSQDWDLALDLVQAARRVSHVPAMLYHWRARAESFASNWTAKPWALVAARRVLEKHLGRIDPRLVAPSDALGSVRIGPADAPRLCVISLGPWEGEDLSYAGIVRRFTVGPVPEAIDELLDAECADDDVILFSLGQAAPKGPVEHMAAFAMQASIGCVLPFQNEGVRRAYTLAPDGSRLEPLVVPRGSFSGYSGNVLAGPLGGLAIRRDAVLALGGVTAVARRFGIESGADPDALGAALGLACLAAGRRNVAVRGVRCAEPFGPVHLSPLPEVDPYL
jgi:hypothetical protein